MRTLHPTRRDFLYLAGSSLAAQSADGAIDRRSLVRRHNPTLAALDPRSPLSVGNGEFAFTADITGLQSLPQPYESGIPLCTQFFSSRRRHTRLQGDWSSDVCSSD